MWVPVESRTAQICNAAVSNDPDALKYIPQDKTWGRELCRAAVQQSGSSLEFVPPSWKDEQLCLLAVQQIGDALQWVPPELRTIEICRVALSNDPAALEYVPQNKRWIRDLMEEGHLLTVHFHDMENFSYCSELDMPVEVTNMSGDCLVTMQINPCNSLQDLLAMLHAQLDAQDYTFPKRFVLPNGRFLHDWEADALIGNVLFESGLHEWLRRVSD